MQREMESGSSSLLPADSPEVNPSTSTDALGITSAGLPGSEPTQSHFAIHPEPFEGDMHTDAEAFETKNLGMTTLPPSVESRSDGNHVRNLEDSSSNSDPLRSTISSISSAK
jgi:hypothetical protein